ncbi:hypothetical protein A3C91_00925 [Candidatus Azambacteria bacterium RIFCSPHIGHO2_02_FULL_52_12]|uniref:Uncharacterized protein n=1 Tax=Candidatus Azambacteria bacterium RIFCSPLOWO2_01_FULL_46_25 TaxID=1797298 RepID=A0A1F5BU21_9BACT|nr:MAG: hypothetical protein A3C91_00925 [Candidatus Azambacteria bacterium RIFCSPHIGHO2_02_FULL_52_12]OGD34085.1 MAG: hypothetical protein A2988_01205 [Candidatus Azambacteria bacterium RIFCSPLOWO2_01_FULL_46_25]OGD36684.1 MAG: hypothetical protein A2850_00160 [Candidatus Azambacteria bacterium RIFCSPHIGHO2_01_FULL_51_74]
MKTKKKEEIGKILLDMARCTPREIFIKYNIGFKTQEEIKESVVMSFFDKVAENYCSLCSLKFFKNKKQISKTGIVN